MNDWKTILSLARRSLLVMACALALAVALFVGSDFFKQRASSSLTQSQQVAAASEASLSEKQADLANLKAEIEHFKTLRAQGMVGEPDRQGWIEQLIASRQRAGLPDTLVYSLQAPKPIGQSGEEVAGGQAAPSEADPGATQVQGAFIHDLNIELTGIHEEELLAFLQSYEANVKGRFRVNACNFPARTEIGLSAQCTLRFFTLADTAAEPAAQP